MTNDEFRRWTRWDDGLGCHLLPLAPSTLYDDDGLPVGRSWWDHEAGSYQFRFIEPSNAGTVTEGWDEQFRRTEQFDSTWDGAIPEMQRFGTPGHSRGLLLEFYPRLGNIREFPLAVKLIPRGKAPVWQIIEGTPTSEKELL